MSLALRTAALVAFALSAAPARAATPSSRLEAPDLTAIARSVPTGGPLRVEGVRLDDARPAAVLVLERFEALAPDARIVVHGDEVTEERPPDNRYFRGQVEDVPGSRAALTFLASGGVRGLVASGGRFWLVDTAPGSATPEVGEVPPESLRARPGWRCGVDQLEQPPALPGMGEPDEAPPARTTGASYAAHVAIETDYEFFQLFGNSAAELNYILELFAFSSGAIYAPQVDTSLLVSYVSLWTTPSDPWTAATTNSQLDQFRNYWIANHASLVRTTAHFLSGRTLGGGVAYLGALCSNSFGFGVSANLEGSFSLANPSVVWDIVVVSHEIGHNFSSPHTHCYANYAGNPNPVDKCYSGEGGCYSGPTSLPGPPGGGSGTLMSYCHLLPPGLSNFTLTLGAGHPYGSGPDRVPSRMSAYVVQTAAVFPACLAAPVPVSVADAPPVLEGSSGATNASFAVTLAQPSAANVSVSYATANGSAVAGSDYTAVAGTLTLAAGATSAAVTVPVIGDTLIELDESFFLNLTGGSGVTLLDGQGQGLITTDDFPALLLGDAAVVEGDAGQTNATFTAMLSTAGLLPVTVAYSTANGTATAGSDYSSTAGSISFPAGTTSQVFNVPVLGDIAIEPDETFLVNLASPANATLAGGQGVGTIADDDAVSLARNELVHGSVHRGNLGLSDTVFYRVVQAPRASYEAVVDAPTGRITPILLERLAADNSTVLQAAVPVHAGGTSVSLRWSNPTPGPVTNQHLRLHSGSCTLTCDQNDSYRIRLYDTTCRIARFNNSATQVTVLVLENTGADTVTGSVHYWSASGALLARQPFTTASHSTFVVNTSAVAGLAGKSGSITVSHDGRHGVLAGKAVAVEPATGFTFDTPLSPRSR